MTCTHHTRPTYPVNVFYWIFAFLFPTHFLMCFRLISYSLAFSSFLSLTFPQTCGSLQQEKEVSVLLSRAHPFVSFPSVLPAFQSLISHSSAKIRNKPQQWELSVNILFSLHTYYLFCFFFFSPSFISELGESEEVGSLFSNIHNGWSK